MTFEIHKTASGQLMEARVTRMPFNKWKPIEIMLAVLFLVAPFVYFPNIGGTGLRIPNNITVWLVVNCIAWYSLYLIAKRQQLAKPKYFSFIIAFPVLATVSGFISDVANPVEWFFRLLFIWMGLLFFLGLFQHKLSQGRIDRILFVIVISALLQCLVGIIQITVPHAMTPVWFPSIANITVQPFGVFQQINNQSSYQVTALVIAIYLISRPYIHQGPFWKKMVLFIFFALSAYIISLSGSRIGLLSALLAIPLVLFARWSYLKKQKNLSLIALLYLIGGISFGASGFGTVLDKTEQISEGYTASYRVGIYAVSLDLIKQKPLFGHGIGSFKKVWQFEKAVFYEKHPDANLIEQYVTHPHNEFLFWAVEGGVAAVIGMLLVITGILLSLKGQNRYRWGVFVAFLLPIILHTQVELPFYTSAVHWFLTLFLLFVLMRINTNINTLKLSSSALASIRIFSAALLMFGTTFLIHSMKANYELSNIKNNLWNASAAKVNPYFSHLLDSVQMKTIFLYNHREGKKQDIPVYIEWAENYLSREPSETMFIYLALAYQDMGNEEQMCRIMQQGAGIYPQNADLKNGLNYCDN